MRQAIFEAARTFRDHLHLSPMVGEVAVRAPEGVPTLFVFLKLQRHQVLNALPDQWEGFPVEVRFQES